MTSPFVLNVLGRNGSGDPKKWKSNPPKEICLLFLEPSLFHFQTVGSSLCDSTITSHGDWIGWPWANFSWQEPHMCADSEPELKNPAIVLLDFLTSKLELPLLCLLSATIVGFNCSLGVDILLSSRWSLRQSVSTGSFPWLKKNKVTDNVLNTFVC